MQRLLFLAAVVIAVVAEPAQATPPDGIYQVHEKGDGPKIVRNDTGAVMHLGRLLTDKLGTPSMQSDSNDNSILRLNLSGVGAYPADAMPAPGAIVIGGRCFMIYSQSDPAKDGTRALGARIHGADAVRDVAKAFKVEPKLRVHPGHKFLVTFEPDKAKYLPGEPITLTMSIKNVGDNTVTFFDGGRQRGARDNQFGFTAFRGGESGIAVPDTGDSTHFGGIGGQQTLKPREVFRKTVRLDKWFAFTDTDTYHITATYILEFHDPDNRGTYQPTWNDFAVGTCAVRIEAPAKKEK